MAKKLAYDFNYLDGRRIVSVPAGTILDGSLLEVVTAIQPTWIVEEKDTITPPKDTGRVEGIKLTEAEKPAKPKDEDPKDPDKLKKKI